MTTVYIKDMYKMKNLKVDKATESDLSTQWNNFYHLFLFM